MSVIAPRLASRVLRNVLQSCAGITLVLFAVSCLPLVAATGGLATTSTLTVTSTSSGSAVTAVTPGTEITLTATVKAGSTSVFPGQVYFCDATATYCSDVHVVAKTSLTSAGTATFRFFPGTGAHQYKAYFLGTSSYTTSTSSSSGLTVASGSTSSTSTTIAQSGSAGNYTLTATTTGSLQAYPTGAVSFVDTNHSSNVIATAAATAAGPTFSTAGPYTANYQPQALASGDFNEDGLPDFAVANTCNIGGGSGGSCTGGPVDIFLANGDGTFHAGTNLLAYDALIDIAVADFNGDGHLDIAVVSDDNLNSSQQHLQVFLGNGNGSFQTVKNYTFPVIENPYYLTVADFNNDGKLDIAIGCVENGYLCVLLGNGDGTFTRAANVADGVDTQQVVSGDFDGDGKVDLAASVGDDNGSNIIELKKGNGDGTFTANGQITLPATGGNAASVGWMAVADVNGDGHPDILALDGVNNKVYTFLNNGSGGFTVVNSAPAPAPQPLTSSLGGTLNPRLRHAQRTPVRRLGVVTATTAAADQSVSISVGGLDDGISNNLVHASPVSFSGSFGVVPSATSTGGAPVFVSVADFNGDGKPDMAVENYSDNTVTFYMGNGDGTFQAASSTVTVGTSPYYLAVGDFNKDGRPDVLNLNAGASTVNVILNTGAVSKAIATGVVAPGTGTHTVAASYAGDTYNAGSTSGTTNLTGTATPPTANSQSVTVTYNTAKAITLTGSTSSGGSLTYNVATAPSHGTLSGTAPNLTYTPTANYSGSDSFTFTVNDGASTSSAATVSITVTAAAPTANSQSVSVAFNTATAVTLTGSTPNSGHALTYTVATAPSHGTLSGTAPSLTYTPASNYSGSDSFTFYVNDGAGGGNSNTAMVSITVAASTPTANGQSVTVPYNTATAITLTGSTPNNGHSLTYTVTTAPSHGTLSGTAPNLTYTPNINYTGADTLKFYVNDGAGGGNSTTATVSITVATAVLPPTIVESFSVSPVAPGTHSTVSFTLGNPASNTVSLTNVSFSDTYPANLVGATGTAVTACVNGSPTFTALAGGISLTGATLAPGATCTITVSVSSSVAGTYTNTSRAVTASNASASGNAASANLTVSGTRGITIISPTIHLSEPLNGGPNAYITAYFDYTGTTAPTGAVTMLVDGSSANISGQTCTVKYQHTNCTASFSALGVSLGSHTLTVTQAGDGNYVAVTGTGFVTIAP